MIRYKRPDVIPAENNTKKTEIIEISVPYDSYLHSTIKDKNDKYTDLCFEVTELWRMQNMLVVCQYHILEFWRGTNYFTARTGQPLKYLSKAME